MLSIVPYQVKRSLAILDQHNLLQFGAGPRSIFYSICPDRVMQLIQAPRAILVNFFYQFTFFFLLLKVTKTLYEAVAEAIFEDILAQGRTCCSDCIRRVSKCLDNMPFDKVYTLGFLKGKYPHKHRLKVKDDFVRLAEAQIIIRCNRILHDELDQQSQMACPAFEPEPDPFLSSSFLSLSLTQHF